MEVKIHLPRKSEAELNPTLEQDLIVRPKFYKRTGWVPVFHMTTVDEQGNEELYTMVISAATKQIRVDKLVEVVPACDDPKRSKVKAEVGDVEGVEEEEEEDDADNTSS